MPLSRTRIAGLLVLLLMHTFTGMAAGDEKSVADSLKAEGLRFKNEGNYYEALQLYKKALNSYRTLQVPKEVADCYNKLGVVCYRIAEYDEALKYYCGSLHINDSLNNDPGLLKNYINLGNFYSSQHNCSTALHHYANGISVAERLEDSEMQALLFNNMGNVFLDSPSDNLFFNLDSSNYYFQKALNIYRVKHHLIGEAGSYQNIGLVFELREELDIALFYYEKSLQLFLSEALENQTILLYKNIGNIYGKWNQHDHALKNFKKALELAQRYDQKNSIQAIANNIARELEKQGRWQEAMSYFRLYDVYKDTVFNETKARQIEELNTKYEVVQKEKALAEAGVEISRKTAERNGYLISLAIALAMTIVLVIIYQQRQSALRDLRVRDRTVFEQRVNELLMTQEVKSLEAMMEGQESERKRIARELHDRLGSLLTSAKLFLQKIPRRQRELLDAENLINEAIDEARSLSHSLASGVLAKFGLAAALYDFKEMLQSHNQIGFELDLHNIRGRMNTALEVDLYRVVQELVSNTLKHAQADHISLQLSLLDDEKLTLLYEDDGKGFDLRAVSWRKGIGIKNIETRVQKHGGTLHIDSQPTQGMRAIIEIKISTYHDEAVVSR